ncbi:hypothetical protein QNI19_32155 [Cytophagaceae bacterium DM2B3-1]|uniref:Sugar-binding protein n=1 Tax=Xanthocytophaga flava TaxID=3048013 RepID=A0ABT7CV70_9BACT|nr:hypothetical protein [Xanthocytophaga flavus]MDJ1497637.1 hypothetical protein [Xanthocytophaga flavus]
MNLFLFFISVPFICCSSEVKTDEKSIKKIITVTEYLVLNKNFDTLDTLHQQKEIKKIDINNNLVEDLDYWGPTSTFAGGLIYKYNKENKIVDEYLLDIHNEVSSKYEYKYSNNIATKFEVLKNNTKIKRKLYYYDTNNNLVRETTYYDDGNVMSDFYFKYDSTNQQVERTGTLDSKNIESIYKSYDGFSNLIEQKSIDTSGTTLSVEKFIYDKFDRNGNWEIRKSMLQGVPHSVAFQKIENK